MGNFNRLTKDFSAQVWNFKELYFYLISIANSKVKCARFILPFKSETFLLKCNYKPREILKFLLELEHEQIGFAKVVIWFEDGFFVDYGYGQSGPFKVEIPKELQG